MSYFKMAHKASFEGKDDSIGEFIMFGYLLLLSPICLPIYYIGVIGDKVVK